MWTDYFTNAHLFGVDHQYHNTVRHRLEKNPRVTLARMDAYAMNSYYASKLRWANESMDIVIDDAAHELSYNQNMLVRFWRFVRPGGYYIIEE